MIGDLNILSVSDIHLLHDTVPTSYIVRNLTRDIKDVTSRIQLDYLLIPGDLFDHLRTWEDEDVHTAELFVHFLLDLAYRRKFKLRVMKGTPLHDRDQSAIFDVHNKARGDRACDLLYVDNTRVVIEADGTSWLYIPDGNPNPDSDWENAIEAVRLAGLEKVDFAIMHGMFGYQLPPGVPIHHHDERRYLDLVEGYIFIGHVHTPSRYKRILAQGSYDRLAHGQEEEKGFYIVETSTHGREKDRITFYVNKGAMPFRDVNITGYEFDEAITFLSTIAEGMGEAGNIKVRMRLEQQQLGLYDHMKVMYGQINWKRELITDNVEEAVVENESLTISIPNITPESMPIMLRDFMLRSWPAEEVDKALELLSTLEGV